MTPSSSKAKGRRLQNYVRDQLLLRHPHLDERDVRGAIMGERGRDIPLSSYAERSIPFDIECKNVESINIWAALQQARENSHDPSRVPLVIFKRNHSEVYATLKLDDLLRLIQ